MPNTQKPLQYAASSRRFAQMANGSFKEATPIFVPDELLLDREPPRKENGNRRGQCSDHQKDPSPTQILRDETGDDTGR